MFEFKLENENGAVININDEVNFIVISASGLTPPQANLFLSTSPNKKGVKYNGSNLDERNISITIKILGDVEANRNALYDWVTSEQYIKIYYRNGIKNVYCEGYVVIPKIDMFTSNEVAILSISCPDPYWKDLQDIQIEMGNLLKSFKFPFAINNNGIPFSTIKSSVDTNIYNSGNETGLLIRVVFNDTVSDFVIENANDVSQKIQFKSSFSFSQGDTLLINTDNSPRTIQRINVASQLENILKYVEGKPYWFTLKKGNNTFTYDSSNNSAIELTISFTNKYLGV